MITVADILALPAFHKWDLLGGSFLLSQRKVWNMGIVDAAVAEDAYSDYRPGEFIVSNLGFARDNYELAERSLCAMLSRDLAAMAIRNVYGIPITDAIKKASNKSGTPLIVYEGEYYEQIIFQGMKLLERDKIDSDIARLIDGLLQSRTPESIREVFYQAIKASGSTVQCAVLRPINGDEASLYAQIDELVGVTTFIKREWERVETASVFRYHDCAIVLVTYNRPPAAFSIQTESEFMQLLQPHGRLVGGISEELPLSEGDLAVREAFAALENAKPGKQPIVRWAAMGVSAFKKAAQSDRLISSTCELYKQMLQDQDEKSDSNLLGTAEAFAAARGDVRATAEALFQHRNTVRYRLHKLKAVLNMEDASDRELAYFLMLVFLV
ncbi:MULTISPECIES: PucR family transcriptional regulator [unclassified Adlercreutzia]|uniref:PucR family transcriptional regulator n=1 Tax=unclassified Adlercreutzia TaxID=2636013 RepID=UPI0013ECB151|nr:MULTISPECIES: PucR family transcriptional regulator [unclassified Adlercreutzia]